MAKNDNLNDFLTDIANAIRTKKGTEDPINAQDFATEISNITVGTGGSTSVRPTYTGHADVEGLKAIGWTEEDIAYYQANGVNWNEEDDEWHKVTDDNKALYGVLTASNISTYKDRIVYLPKIDTSGVTSMNSMFNSCYSLTAIPMLDTSNVVSMMSMFRYCPSLITIPPLNTSNVKYMTSMFELCLSLTSIPMLDTSKAEDMSKMFQKCYSLTSIPQLDTSKVTNMSNMFYQCYSLTHISPLNVGRTPNTANIFYYCNALISVPPLGKLGNYGSLFDNCTSLVSIPEIDLGGMGTSNSSRTFSLCTSLTHANMKNLKCFCDLSYSSLFSKSSLLYLINNEAATSAITITLHSYAYERLANDPDIVAALTDHPNVSLASA